jgi:hypothetical protein
MAETVERNIFFYRVLTPGSHQPVDVSAVLAALLVNAADPEKRYWTDSGETHLSKVDGEDRARFAYTRRTTLPQVEENGQFSNLKLKSTAGLADATHVRFFADSVAGADYNFRGPSAVRFGHFITANTGIRVAFQPLLKADVLKDLDQIKDVTLVSLKVNTAFASRVKRHDENLGQAIQATRAAAGDGVVELRITPPRYSRDKSVHGLKVEGRASTGNIDLNLLREKLVYRSAIVTVDTRHRILDIKAAYSAIGAAHAAMKDEIDIAASIG